MIEVLYKLLNLCIAPFQLYGNLLIMIPLSLLTCVFIVGLFMRLLKR